MEGSESIYSDKHFSVNLVKAQLAVPTKAKILQIFYHKLYSIDANAPYDSTALKQKVALPPFVVRSPEEVPLAIALIKEKSEDFQHKFKLNSTIPKQYSDARLAMSLLDPEVIRHILSCFTKGKLKEMEDMTKTLTNRHGKRNNTLDRYMAKLDNGPVRSNTQPLFVRAPTLKIRAPKGPEFVEEAKIFTKAALVDSNASSTAFRLDTSAPRIFVGGKTSEELEKFKSSRKLKLKAEIRISKIHVNDINTFSLKISNMNTFSLKISEMKKSIFNDHNKESKRSESSSDDVYTFNDGQKDRKRKASSSDNDEYVPVTATKKVRKAELKPNGNRNAVNSKGKYMHETVEDIMAQFEPCSKFIVENDRTLVQYNCRVCDDAIYHRANQTSKNALTVHYRKEHQMERHYQCDRCDLILPSIDVWYLERHSTSSDCRPKGLAAGQQSNIIKCEKCDQKFAKSSSYADHYKKTHTSIFKDYLKKKVECDGCGLKFTTQSMLDLHKVYEQKLCKVPCSVCKDIIEVKLNCKLEKVFKESGLVDSVKCKSCS